MKTLSDAILRYVADREPDDRRIGRQTPDGISTLFRAASRILYVLCKVRGYKVIVQLLNNETRYVGTMLDYASSNYPNKVSNAELMWEEWYIQMLWLSHLMLAPFSLTSMSAQIEYTLLDDKYAELYNNLPIVATSVLKLGLDHLFSPGKEREAAVILICRLALRADMQAVDVLERIANFAVQQLQEESEVTLQTTHHDLGLLLLLFRILNLATSSEASPHIAKVFQCSVRLLTQDDSRSVAVRNTAPCRKMLIKTLRAAVHHALKLDAELRLPSGIDLDSILGEAVQIFLDALGDKDTPVRAAAAKNLAMLTMELDRAMQSEVIGAVVESFDENMLLQHPRTGAIIPATDMPKDPAKDYRRDLSAVAASKWQGLLLTLAQLLFRRVPATTLLPGILDSLVLGLNFEQRSNVGTSIGTGVRDAACFGIWSLVRKYLPSELSVLAPDVRLVKTKGGGVRNGSILQRIATELNLASCLDSSGNIRRGSSAALQELVGRHPDVVENGIALVQIVDYQAVARRASAMCEVGTNAAFLSRTYLKAFVFGLTDWRGSRAADIESRRLAAKATATVLNSALGAQLLRRMSKATIEQLRGLKSSNVGATAEARHGLLLALAAMIDTSLQDAYTHLYAQLNFNFNGEKILDMVIAHLIDVVGNIHGRIGRDSDLVLEGAATLMAAILRFVMHHQRQNILNEKQNTTILTILQRCLNATDSDTVIQAASGGVLLYFQVANEEAQEALVNGLLTNEASRGFRGRIQALGELSIVARKSSHGQQHVRAINLFLKSLLEAGHSIEVRTQTMECLVMIISNHQAGHSSDGDDDYSDFNDSILAGLSDYSKDQRGDIGSSLRLQSIHAANRLLGIYHEHGNRLFWIQSTAQRLVRLACEKLNKTRYEAWLCLREHWSNFDGFPTIPDLEVSHVADVSSPAYYGAVCSLFSVEWLQEPLVIGLTSSAVGSTEDIGRACCEAIVTWLLTQKPSDRLEYSQKFLLILLRRLRSVAEQDDHELIPLIDMLMFLLSTDLVDLKSDDKALFGVNAVSETLASVQETSASVARLEALLRVYALLCRSDALRGFALDRITRLLLHRYPKV